jgi:hypothetical protein
MSVLKNIFLFLLLNVLALGSYAQSPSQLWLEYKPTIMFEKGYKLGMRASYRTDFVDPRWSTTELRFMPEKKFNKYVDGILIFQTLNTVQSHQLTTNEIRPAIGARGNFTPGRRVETSMLARFEYRFVYDDQENAWNDSPRFRLKVDAQIPFNHKDMSADKTWYGRGEIEAFYIESNDINEVYANRLWFDLTVGYKFNSRFKLELVYTLQDSRNTADTRDLTRTNIFKISVLQSFN